MKIIPLFLAFVICLFSCNRHSENLNIPDTVTSTRDASSRQFAGTRIFIKPPKNYNPIPQLLRFQKDTTSYLQIFEVPFTAFDAQKVKAKFEENIKSGKLDKEYYQKEFRFGNYKAILVYGADNKPKQDQMVLCFGDNSFVVMALGELPSRDKAARDEVLKSLLSIYVDTTIAADASVLANYELDLTNTEFKYAGNMSQTYIYNPGGTKLNADDEYTDALMVSTLPAMPTEQLKQMAISMIGRFKTNGMKIPDYKAIETTLNGNYAYEINFAGSYKERPFIGYMIATTNAKGAVLFVGNAYNRQPELMQQIRKIAATLRPK